jgi:hypothetical protein
MWYQTLDQMILVLRKMPHDVSTQWNLMFDMLDFALEYWDAIDDLTGSKTAGLRQYELNDVEWGTVHHLYSSLKVRLLFPIWYSLLTCLITYRFSKM